MLTLRLVSENDLGFHLHGGQWILQNHSFPSQDSFTYTVSDHPYINLHWLYQILLYAVYVVAGFNGISILHTLLIVTLFYLMYYWMYCKKIPFSLTSWLLLGAVLTVEVRFNFRPEIMTWIFMILMLIGLDHYLRNRQRTLWILPLIMILWTNTQGLFVIGILIMGAYALSDFGHSRKVDRYLWLWSFLGVIAILINPYFIDGAMFPIELATRLQSASIFKDSILEFASPWSSFVRSRPTIFPPLVISLYYTFTFVSGILILVTIKNRKIHEIIISLTLFLISFSQFRNIPLFVLYMCALDGEMLVEIWNRFFGMRKISSLIILQQYAHYLFIVTTLLMSLRVVTNAYYVSDRRLIQFGWGLDHSFTAESAAQYMKNQALNGRFLNNIAAGNWLGWRLNKPVYIDGRLEVMQEQLYSEYQNSFKNSGLKVLMDRYQPQLVVFNYAGAMSWQSQLKNIPTWRMIYWDDNTALYAHDEYAVHLPQIRFEDELIKMGYDTTATNMSSLAVWLGAPESSVKIWISGFYEKQEFPVSLLHRALFAESANEWRTAERLYFEFIKKNRGRAWEAFYNLGMVYYRQGAWENALRCFERYLTYEPKQQKVQRLILECNKNIRHY